MVFRRSIQIFFVVCFFFFKQKTAYEIMPSLVGSEMCIRDRGRPAGHADPPRRPAPPLRVPGRPRRGRHGDGLPGGLPPLERRDAGLAPRRGRWDPARSAAHPVDHVPLEGRGVDGARGVRHVRPRLRGQPRPAADLPAGRVRELPAPQGLPPPGRRVALSWRRRAPDGGRRHPRRRRRDHGPAHGQGPLAHGMAMTTPTRPSLDDPSLTTPVEHAGIFEPIPLARTERQREFYDLRDGEMLLNMGPQHPSTHGVLRVVLKISGEQVVDLDPVLGYLHRGVEKIAENSDFHHIISQLDPLEYVASLFCEWSPVMSFEKLLDVQVPRRAEYIRVLTGELNRIASHMLFMGWYALDLGLSLI